MKKRSAFKYLYESQDAKEPLIWDEYADKMANLLTAEDLRALRDPNSPESRQILELIGATIH